MATARKANTFVGYGRESPCASPRVFGEGSTALAPPHLRFRPRRGHLAPRRLLGVGPGCPARFSSPAGPRRRRRARCLLGLVVFRGWRRGALLPGNRLSLRLYSEMRPVGPVPRCVMVLVVFCGKGGNGGGGAVFSVRCPWACRLFAPRG